MAIEIIDEPTIRLTQAEYDRLVHEYRDAYTHHAGPVPSFEKFVQRSLQKRMYTIFGGNKLAVEFTP